MITVEVTETGVSLNKVASDMPKLAKIMLKKAVGYAKGRAEQLTRARRRKRAEMALANHNSHRVCIPFLQKDRSVNKVQSLSKPNFLFLIIIPPFSTLIKNYP